MFGLDLNNQFVKACLRILKTVPGIQKDARNKLTSDLQAICTKCDDAYSAVLQRLVPVKNAFHDPDKLANELRSIAADPDTRSAFKPEHLCGEIDHLTTELSSNLSALKYSIDFGSLSTVRRGFESAGNFDTELYHQYDSFMYQLNSIATEIQKGDETQGRQLAEFAQAEIEDFEVQLRSGIDQMRETKKQILSAV